MYLFFFRNVLVNRILVETLKKYYFNLVEIGVVLLVCRVFEKGVGRKSN